MEKLFSYISSILWGPAFVSLCIVAAILFSLATRFAVVRHIPEIWRLMFNNKKATIGISSHQAFMFSLGGRIGLGNIAGVLGSIAIGGPGAVFWMWATGILMSSTAFIEATHAQIYKTHIKIGNQFFGGPAFYFENIFNSKSLGIFIAILSIMGYGLFLPALQTNGIIIALEKVILGPEASISYTDSWGDLSVSRLAILTTFLFTISFFIFGGIRLVAKFCQIITPLMLASYSLLALIIIGLNIELVPIIIKTIITEAFSLNAGIGGIIGIGFKRALFSSEAGLGKGAHISAAADVNHPVEQGLLESLAVYIDTLVICTLTALMVFCSGIYDIHETVAANNVSSFNSLPMLLEISPNFISDNSTGTKFLSIVTICFSFTTILSTLYIAEANVAYVSKAINIPFELLSHLTKTLIVILIAYASISESGPIWKLGGISMAIVAWINIGGMIVILFSYKPVMKALKDYEAQKKSQQGLADKKYVFNPIPLKIKNATYWESIENTNKTFTDS